MRLFSEYCGELADLLAQHHVNSDLERPVGPVDSEPELKAGPPTDETNNPSSDFLLRLRTSIGMCGCVYM